MIRENKPYHLTPNEETHKFTKTPTKKPDHNYTEIITISQFSTTSHRARNSTSSNTTKNFANQHNFWPIKLFFSTMNILSTTKNSVSAPHQQ